MSQNGLILGLLLLTFHILCCVFVYLGIKTKLLHVKMYLIAPVICIPIWGVLCVLILHFQIGIHGEVKKEVGVGRLKVREEIYKSVFVENEDAKNVVPLEEALIINDPDLRRNMIMDMLNDDPSEYIELLHQARMNEDVDVVHYATTAMAELQKEYDLKLQKLEQRYSTHPDDPKILNEYCEFLCRYIEQVGEGQMEVMQRNQYAQLLQKKLEHKLEQKTCVQLAENYLKLEDYGKAKEILDIMKKNWPKREEYWLLKTQYYAKQKRGKELLETVREVERQHIYLSTEAKEELAFWQQSIERENKSEDKRVLEETPV